MVGQLETGVPEQHFSVGRQPHTPQPLHLRRIIGGHKVGRLFVTTLRESSLPASTILPPFFAADLKSAKCRGRRAYEDPSQQ